MVVCTAAQHWYQYFAPSESKNLSKVPVSRKRERSGEEHSAGIGLYVRGINTLARSAEKSCVAGVPITSNDVAPRVACCGKEEDNAVQELREAMMRLNLQRALASECN